MYNGWNDIPKRADHHKGESIVNVEQWDCFELALNGPSTGNPFTDVDFSARFSNDEKSIDVAGFYDGEGVYRVRFMPGAQGVWRYETRSERRELDRKTGEFECVAPSRNNHGPVRVAN